MRHFIKLVIILSGILVILSVLPIAIFIEVSQNGCCGAPGTGKEGQGFFVGALIGITGIVLIVYGIKFKRHPTK